MNGSPVCQNCGQCFAEFQKSGLLGCSACYTAFASELTDIFKRLHGATRHIELSTLRNEDLDDLEKRLKDAVSREAYEEASRIRDRILTQRHKAT